MTAETPTYYILSCMDCNASKNIRFIRFCSAAILKPNRRNGKETTKRRPPSRRLLWRAGKRRNLESMRGHLGVFCAFSRPFFRLQERPLISFHNLDSYELVATAANMDAKTRSNAARAALNKLLDQLSKDPEGAASASHLAVLHKALSLG